MSLKNSGTFKREVIGLVLEAPTRLGDPAPGGSKQGGPAQAGPVQGGPAQGEDVTYENVEVEILADGRSARGGDLGHAGAASAPGWPSSAKTLLWTFPGRVRAGTPGVTMLATVGVGAAEAVEATPGATSPPTPEHESTSSREPRAATRSPDLPQRPLRRAGAIIDANNPTRIFVAPAARDVRASGEANRATPAPGAPLLRAFEDRQRSVAWWSTAQTVSGPSEEEGPAGATARLDLVAAGEPKPRPRPPRRRERVRQSTRATKKILALVVTTAAVVAAGTLLPRNVLESVIPGHAGSAPAVAKPAAVRGEPRAEGAAPAPAPLTAIVAPNPLRPAETSPTPSVAKELAAAEELPSTATPAEPSPKRAPDVHVAPVRPLQDQPAKAREGSGSKEGTLARQAVDALLAGDRAKALQHYRELSRRAPDHEVYREAVRLLSPTMSARSP